MTRTFASWKCLDTRCPDRAPIEDAFGPTCYTCGAEMTRVHASAPSEASKVAVQARTHPEDPAPHVVDGKLDFAAALERELDIDTYYKNAALALSRNSDESDVTFAYRLHMAVAMSGLIPSTRLFMEEVVARYPAPTKCTRIRDTPDHVFVTLDVLSSFDHTDLNTLVWALLDSTIPGTLVTLTAVYPDGSTIPITR